MACDQKRAKFGLAGGGDGLGEKERQIFVELLSADQGIDIRDAETRADYGFSRLIESVGEPEPGLKRIEIGVAESSAVTVDPSNLQ